MKRLALLLAKIACFLMGSVLGQDLAITSPQFQVVLKERTENPKQGVSFRFEATDRRTQRKHLFDVQNRMTDISSGWIHANRFILVGKVGNSADMVTVGELPDGKPTHSFLCYGPIASPSGKFVLYRAFYPRFSDPPLHTDVLLLTDVSAVTKGEDPGVIVFPDENVKAQSTDRWIEDPQMRHHVLSGLGVRWLDSESGLIFAESTQGKYWLVHVDLRKPGPRSFYYALDVPASETIPTSIDVKDAKATVSFQGFPAVTISLNKASGKTLSH